MKFFTLYFLIFSNTSSQKMFVPCKELPLFVMVCLIIIGVFTIIPVMMIVYGAHNPTVSCVSPCILQECVMPGNAPYILPTPPIGINMSQALIIGGVIGIVLEIAFAIFAIYNKKERICTPIVLLPTIPFLCATAWMIVSFIVYSQTIQLCTAYKSWWSVDMTALKWLLGANIGGMILLLGPYVVPFAIAALCAPCTNSSNVSGDDVTQFSCCCPLYIWTCECIGFVVQNKPTHTPKTNETTTV